MKVYYLYGICQQWVITAVFLKEGEGGGVLLYINFKGKIFLILNLSKFILNKMNFKIEIDQGGTPPLPTFIKKIEKVNG